MINQVTLIGNLGQDPKVAQTKGSSVANLRIATSRAWKDKNSGEKKEETEWHDVEVWGKTAELCGEYLTKGRKVYVLGRIKTDRWQTEDGADKFRVKIIADVVKFLDHGQATEE